jgi:hypothetical protein
MEPAILSPPQSYGYFSGVLHIFGDYFQPWPRGYDFFGGRRGLV